MVMPTRLQLHRMRRTGPDRVPDLLAVVSSEAALAPGAPFAHDEAPGHLAFDYESGNEHAAAAAIAQARTSRARSSSSRASRPIRWTARLRAAATTGR